MALTEIAENLATQAGANIVIEQIGSTLYAVTVTMTVLPHVQITAGSPFLGNFGLQEVAFRIHVVWELLVHQTFLPNVIKEYRQKCETTA